MGMRINGVLINNDDLNQRYRNTFVEISVAGSPPKVVECVEFSQNGAGAVLYCRDNKMEMSEIPLKSLSIVRDFPDMGACNFDGDVYVLRIRPERQWARGLCHARLHSFSRNKQNPALEDRLDLQVAQAVFNRQYISEPVGLKLLAEGKVRSFAMDASYWYSGTPKRAFLWRGRACLGELLQGRLFFFNESSSLAAEVRRDLGKANV